MKFPKPLYIVVAGGVVLNLIVGVNEKGHPVHEVFPDHLPQTIVTTTSGTVSAVTYSALNYKII